MLNKNQKLSWSYHHAQLCMTKICLYSMRIVYNLTAWRLSLRWSSKQMPVALHDFTTGMFTCIMQNTSQPLCMIVRSTYLLMRYENQTAAWLQDTYSIFIMQNRRHNICMAVLSYNYHARQRSDPLRDCKPTYLPCRTELQAICMTVYCVIIIMQYRGLTTSWLFLRPPYLPYRTGSRQFAWLYLSNNYHARQMSESLHDCKTHTESRPFAWLYYMKIIMQDRGQTLCMTVRPTYLPCRTEARPTAWL